MGITGSTEKETQPTKSSSTSTPTSPRVPPPASPSAKPDKLKPQTKPVSIKRDFDDDDEITLISSPTSRLPTEFSEKTQEVTTVFSWRHGGKSVYLAGTFNDWAEKIPMRESNGDFTAIQNLPPGMHYYRYIVDGKWQVDPAQPVFTDDLGEKSNVLEVSAPKKEESILSGAVSSSPPGTYTQQVPTPEIFSLSSSNQNASQEPPALPPHLLRALLNTTPPSQSDPTLLPLPHHVMLNHLYSVTRKEDKTVILGITQRYKSKFVTTVLYKPTEQPLSATPPIFHRNTDKKKLVNVSKSMDVADRFSMNPPSVGDDVVFSNFENGNNDFMEMGD